MNVSQYVSTFLNFVKESMFAYQESKAILSESDDKTQDILHTVEMRKLNAISLMRMIVCLRDVRQDRRAAKDEVIVLGPLVQWANKNKDSLKELEAVLGAMRKQEEYTNNRHYFYKTDIVKKCGIDGDVI